MKEKPDPNHLCDEFGTLFDDQDLMCLDCHSFLFCYELHEKILNWVVWATEQDRIAIANGWKRRYLIS